MNYLKFTIKTIVPYLVVLGLVLLPHTLVFSDSTTSTIPKQVVESGLKFPKYPNSEATLRPFVVEGIEEFNFALDANAISVESNGITRYTIVITSNNGVRNVFYEGMRCANREYKIYAYGKEGDVFQEKLDSSWQVIRNNERNVQRYHNVLYHYYLCDKRNKTQLNQEVVLRNLVDNSYIEELQSVD